MNDIVGGLEFVLKLQEEARSGGDEHKGINNEEGWLLRDEALSNSSTEKDKTIASLERKRNKNLTSDVDELKSVVTSLLKDKISEHNLNNNPVRGPTSTYIPTPTPILYSPRMNSFEKLQMMHSILVHHVPLGPNTVRVWVDTMKIPNSFLWRPTSNIIVIDDAVDTTTVE
ncbi:receptor-like protein kinase FERONIA [Cucumis melo var. makuwa]|uniref:Receptor-like protein kinase FERONIA n=2 Tax=Cucumis melo TaxID=3656 RepID=A0A5D3B8L1_CUCMM|nr:receptor-like protein kinase FERONIA [Cucumis melo var. makuwa]